MRTIGIIAFIAILLYLGTSMVMSWAQPVTDDNVKLRDHVLYNDGTERPFSSALNADLGPGTYVDVISGRPLFRSETKFDSGTGWPSFHTPIGERGEDYQLIEEWRPWGSFYEMRSADGERHYGHLFLEKQWPEGRRFCMNGVALKFIPDEDQNDE